MEGGVRENTFEQTAAQWDVYKDIFAPPPPRPRSKPWERAPIPAHAPRLHGQKIWKKAGLRQQHHVLDKENEDAAQLELERGGIGARKRARMLGAKENITDAPWQSITEVDDIKLPENDGSGGPNRANNQPLLTGSPEKLQVVPRKRTNANHLVTPRKSGRRAPLREISTPMATMESLQKSPQKLLLDFTASAAPECRESPRKCSLNDTMTKSSSPEKPVRRRKSLRKSTRRLTTNNTVEEQPATISEASPPRSSFAPSINTVEAATGIKVPLIHVATSQTPAQQLEHVVSFPSHADADATYEESSLPIKSPSTCGEVNPSLYSADMNDENRLFARNSPSNEPPCATEISPQNHQETHEAPQLRIQDAKTSTSDSTGEATLSLDLTEVCRTPRQKRRASSQRPSTRRSQRAINRTATAVDSEACQNPSDISSEDHNHNEVIPDTQTADTSELSLPRNIASDITLDIPSSGNAEQIPDIETATSGSEVSHISAEEVIDPPKIDIQEVKPDTSSSVEVAAQAPLVGSPRVLESDFLLQELSDAAAQVDSLAPTPLPVPEPTASKDDESVASPRSEPSKKDNLVSVTSTTESLSDNKVTSPAGNESVVSTNGQASPASILKVDVKSLANDPNNNDLEYFDPVPVAGATRSILDNVATETEELPETSTPHPSTTELVEAISENAPATSYDHDDTDLLRSFLMRVKANKETKAKEISVPKRKRSFPHSPIKLPLGGEEGTFSPSPPPKDEFDISLPAPSPMKRRKRNEASEDGVETPKSIRRSGRTRLPVKSAVAAPSFIPVRRLGQEGDNTVTLRRSEEKELAALTKINTRKNKGVALSPLELLAKQAEEKDDPALRQKALKEKFDQKSQVQTSKKAKTVVWAEELAQYQTADGKRAPIEKVDDKAKEKTVGVDEKKGAVKVGVRSSRVSLGMAVNGTPAPKRKVKARS